MRRITAFVHFFFQDKFSVNLLALYMHFALQELHDMSRGRLVVKLHVLLQEMQDTSCKMQDACSSCSCSLAGAARCSWHDSRGRRQPHRPIDQGGSTRGTRHRWGGKGSCWGGNLLNFGDKVALLTFTSEN